jgi:hypothetical protein
MEERFVPATQGEVRPMEGSAPGSDDGRPRTGLADPRALQILSTEHWSLLTARSLVYNESFARGGMFMAFLSATLLVLGLISTATGFSTGFLIVAAVILGLDLFVGLATLGRINGASAEDLLYLQGMNRLRNAYHEMVPGLEKYFMTSKYDDFDSVVRFYGPGTASGDSLGGLLHGMTTMPVLISVICCALAAVLTGIIVLLATQDATLAALAAAGLFLVFFAIFAWYGYSSAMAFATKMPAKFPRPRDPGTPDSD